MLNTSNGLSVIGVPKGKKTGHKNYFCLFVIIIIEEIMVKMFSKLGENYKPTAARS